MSNVDPTVALKQGWLKVKLHSYTRWHRRYCIIDWDKAILFISSRIEKNFREWIKLLPNIFINDLESLNDCIIEVKVDYDTHLLQIESKKEYDSWILALKRTAYSRIGGAIFGQSLEDTYKYSLDKTSLVPVIVRECCEYLLEHGSTFVGLFRIPGKQSAIKELRDMYDRGLTIHLDESHSPNTISSLLKIYLQSLPEPIIPVKYFDEFFELGSCLKYNHKSDIVRLKELIGKTLSCTNYALLAYLCLFLKELTRYANETKMDTDNLALTFGNNLIRTSEELDLNMIKGHSYNLQPLIKAFIDHSEYLFSTKPNCSTEHQNVRLMKSSGYPSFSSLESSNQHPIKLHLRSSSMPSIICGESLSINNENFSDHHLSDNYRNCMDHVTSTKMEACANNKSNQFYSQQSFKTDYDREVSIDHDHHNKSQTRLVQHRYSTTDSEKDELHIKQQSMVLESKNKTGMPSHFISSNNLSSGIRKIQKKNFADKIGKSMSNFKSQMSKAFHPHLASNETLQQSNAVDVAYNRKSIPHEKHNMVDSSSLNDRLQSLQNENRFLKELVDEKETLLINLKRTSYEDRVKYERENSLLKQTIEQLQIENSHLKTRYHLNS